MLILNIVCCNVLNRGISHWIWPIAIITIIRLVLVGATDLNVHWVTVGAAAPVILLRISRILFLGRLVIILVAIHSIKTSQIRRWDNRVWRTQILLFLTEEQRRRHNH